MLDCRCMFAFRPLCVRRIRPLSTFYAYAYSLAFLSESILLYRQIPLSNVCIIRFIFDIIFNEVYLCSVRVREQSVNKFC